MFYAKFDEKNKLWRNDDIPCVFNPNISIAYPLLRSMQLNGSRIAQINDNSGERFTFDEIRLQSIRVAQNLQQRGYGLSRQTFGIIAGNESLLAAVVLGSVFLACPINTMYPTVDKEFMMYTFRITQPSVIFCDVNAYDLVKKSFEGIGKSVKIFTFNGVRGDAAAVESLLLETHNEEEFIPIHVDGINDIAFIVGSSGTTGMSKQVCLSHAALISRLDQFPVVNANDIFFYMSGLHWISGLNSFLMGTLEGATRVITTASLSPESMLRIIEIYNVTFVSCSPFYLIDMLKSELLPKADLSQIRHILIGGWKTPLSIIKEFESYLSKSASIIEAYGMTEMAGGVVIGFSKCSNESIGRILNGFTVKIVDENGYRCGIGVQGEICINHRFKFLGYLGDSEAFDQSIDSEGFFLTGDIGFVDKDRRLHIVDRKKNIIYCSEGNIFPSAIENVLLRSNDIAAACVVGVPNGPILEAPAAVVVRSLNSNITVDDIHKMVEDQLSESHKILGGVYFIESLPKTITGKVLRRKVKELVNGIKKKEQSSYR